MAPGAFLTLQNFYDQYGSFLGQPEPLPDAEEMNLALSGSLMATFSTPMSPKINARTRPHNFNHNRKMDEFKGYMEARLGKQADSTSVVMKFLQNDRKVLRFFCTWDEPLPGGEIERRPFRLHYFLADDTVEVLEVSEPNSGRDPFPLLLKRMKLPKPGGGFYAESDMRVGESVVVFARKLVLRDCDEFTRRYFEEQHGIQFMPLEDHDDPYAPDLSKQLIIPPHNGIGKEEDTLMNVLSLHPKPPKTDVMRLLENNKKMLRFVAKLDNAYGYDLERMFIINYHLDTDDMSIFEPPAKNAGRLGGKFLERSKIKKPNSPEYYGERDLFIGAKVNAVGRVFKILDADLYTLKWMDAHPDIFPKSDLGVVLFKIAQADGLIGKLSQVFTSKDATRSGRIHNSMFRTLLQQNTKGILDAQEMLTLVRRWTEEDGYIYYPALLNAAQQTLSNESESAQPGRNPDGVGARAVRRALLRRGALGVRGLARAVEQTAAIKHHGMLSSEDVREALSFCGVAVQDHELFELIGSEGISPEELMHLVRGSLSAAKQNVISRAFAAIDARGMGVVTVRDLLLRYNVSANPRVVQGYLKEDEARREVTEYFDVGRERGFRGSVSVESFSEFCVDVCLGLEDDGGFVAAVEAMFSLKAKSALRKVWN